jgi:hypothetical protein
MAASDDDAAMAGRPADTGWGRLVREGFATLLDRMATPAGEAATVVLVSDGDLSHLIKDLKSLGQATAGDAAVLAFTGRTLGPFLERHGSHELLAAAAEPPRLVIVERAEEVGGSLRQRAMGGVLDWLVERGISVCVCVSRGSFTAGLEPSLESRLASGLVVHVPIRPTTAPAANTPSLSGLIRATARRYGIAPNLLTGPGRSRSAVEVRNLAMYLARRLTGSSFGTIGRAFGGRDHTTVMRGIRGVETRIATDASFAADVESLIVGTSTTGRITRRRATG